MYETQNDEFPIKQVACWVIGILAFCFAIDWIVAGQNFFLYQFFAPRQAAVERKVYENTKQYKQGNTQRLNNLCNEVAQTDADHKPMIYNVISQEFSEWSSDDVPDYLRSCLAKARAH